MKPRAFLVCAAAEPGKTQMIEVPLARVELAGGVPFPSPRGGEVWSTSDGNLTVPRVLRVLVTVGDEEWPPLVVDSGGGS